MPKNWHFQHATHGGHALFVALPLSSTARSTVNRLRERARTDRAELYAVLDSGLVCHLGLVVDGAPVVLPTGYGRIGDTLYVHGSTGAGWLRAAAGAPVCITVTHLDGIVYARSVFHHSMNYRSAVVHAVARLVTDPAERLAALRAVAEQLSPGSWDHARPPTRRELAATALLAVDLAEASVKVRTGPPSDDAEDIAAGGRWAGVLPMHVAFGSPRPAPDLDDVAVPRHVDARRDGVT
jgi:nitroimidazol reductase NimA-like FMN-containing flavoprotein (pyridoxamine 5'-phosphate oxidase superfamily)